MNELVIDDIICQSFRQPDTGIEQISADFEMGRFAKGLIM